MIEPQEPQENEPQQEQFKVPTASELINFMKEFMGEARRADEVFRSNYCELVVNRIFNEFGHEGLCHLMMAIDAKANWISDILIEDSDIDNVLFKKYGIYEENVTAKARNTEALLEMNSKIWRLRKKYARAIADEIINGAQDDESESD